MIGCPSTIAGHCLGVRPFQVFLAVSLWAAAAVMLDKWWLEVRE